MCIRDRLHVIGNRAFISRTSTLLYVPSTFVTWWRTNYYTLHTDGASTRWHRNEASEQASPSTTSTDDQELLTSSTSSLVFCVRLSVSVRFRFLFPKSRFVSFCIRFQKSRFSFASSRIEIAIKDIFSTLMYVKRIFVWISLWLANIFDFLFNWLIITLFFLNYNSLQLSLRGSVMEVLVHVHVLVNAQWHYSCVYRRCH